MLRLIKLLSIGMFVVSAFPNAISEAAHHVPVSVDPPVFEHLGIADQPKIVIGLDFLRKFRFQIDRKSQKVVFGRLPPPGEIGRYKVSPEHGRAPRY